MLSYFLFSCLLVTAVKGDGGAARIGYGFYLPDRDILNNLAGGAKLFKTLPSACIISKPNNLHKRETAYYPNADTFFTRLAAETGLSTEFKSLYTMGNTLNTKSGSIGGTQYQVKGSSLMMYSFTKDDQLAKECINTQELADDFVRDFKNLPDEVKDPHKLQSWDAFKVFLVKYGSHFVTKTSYGAWLEQWVFSHSSKSYSQSQLESRSCSEFLGFVLVGMLNVKKCESYSKTEISASSKLEVSKTFAVKGGSLSLRTALLSGHRTLDNVEKFLKSSDDTSVINNKFSEIWELLQNRFYGTVHYKKALNLEFFYRGYLNYKCNYEAENNYPMQRFARTIHYTKERPVYHCEIPPTGCRNGDDCHIGGWGSVCYCYGKTCIVGKTSSNGYKSRQKRTTRGSQSGSYDSGVNNSCYYKAGVYCSCNTDWGGAWQAVWSSDNSLKK